MAVDAVSEEAELDESGLLDFDEYAALTSNIMSADDNAETEMEEVGAEEMMEAAREEEYMAIMKEELAAREAARKKVVEGRAAIMKEEMERAGETSTATTTGATPDAAAETAEITETSTKEAKEASTVTKASEASRAPSFAGQENTCGAASAGLEGGNCSMWDGSMLSADTTKTLKEDEAGVVGSCCRSSVGFEPLVMGDEEGEEGEMGGWERETQVDDGGQSRGFPETKCAANTFPHFHERCSRVSRIHEGEYSYFT